MPRSRSDGMLFAGFGRLSVATAASSGPEHYLAALSVAFSCMNYLSRWVWLSWLLKKFDVAAGGTAIEGALLEIEEVAGRSLELAALEVTDVAANCGIRKDILKKNDVPARGCASGSR